MEVPTVSKHHELMIKRLEEIDSKYLAPSLARLNLGQRYGITPPPQLLVAMVELTTGIAEVRRIMTDHYAGKGLSALDDFEIRCNDRYCELMDNPGLVPRDGAGPRVPPGQA